MVLSADVWAELVQLGLLDGEETCALCPLRPAILVDVARAPILLCRDHAQRTVAQLLADLSALPPETAPG
jgi:hypothetical protein